MIWRIRDRTTFAQLRREGIRARSGTVSLTYLPEDDGKPPRVAYVVSGKVGNAVMRNTIRRRVRAIMAELSNELGTQMKSGARSAMRSGAYLVRVDPKSAERTFDELATDIKGAMSGAYRRADDRALVRVGS